jgi:hypothetical protein
MKNTGVMISATLGLACIAVAISVAQTKATDKAASSGQAVSALAKAAPAAAKEVAPAKSGAAPAKEKAPAKERTKEEMIERLNKMAASHHELPSVMPGLGIIEKDGKKQMTYKGKLLESYDKETVRKLYIPISRYVTVKNAERIDKQLKQIQQIDNMNRMQRITGQSVPAIPKAPPVPPTTPQVPVVPMPPKTPPPPPRR